MSTSMLCNVGVVADAMDTSIFLEKQFFFLVN